MEQLSRSVLCRIFHGKALLFLCFTLVAADGQAEALPLTLEQARDLAERNNPALGQAQAEIDASEGLRQDARAFLYNNPTAFTSLTRRRSPGASSSEWSLGIEQPIELAGQPRLRRNMSDSDLSAVRASIESLRRSLYAEVERRFLQVQAVETRLATEQEALELIERSAGIVRSRVEAGEDTRLEGNLATVEVGRMRNQLDRLAEERIRAQSELATLLQLPSNALPDASGELNAIPISYTLQALLTSGQNRSVLAALAHREESNRSRLELERAARYPDLTIGVMTAREGPSNARDSISGLTFSLPLPLFKRNAAGIGRAYADLTQTQIERGAAERDVRAGIVSLWERLSKLAARLQRLNASVLPRLDENMRLAQISYQSGEISISELLLATRQVIDARRDIIDATVEHELTRVSLEETAGWTTQRTPKQP